MNNIILPSDNPTQGNDSRSYRNQEETLVVDCRSTLTPSQMVEEKLIGRLKESPLMMSQIQRRLKPGPR